MLIETLFQTVIKEKKRKEKKKRFELSCLYLKHIIWKDIVNGVRGVAVG